MRRTPFLAAACVALACAGALAQDAGGPQRNDPIAEHVLPPELILQHHKAIGLSEAQRTAVINEVKRVQARLIDVQWALQREAEKLVELLGQEKVDEAPVVAQLDKVLASEREIKHAHIVLAVRLRNILTPEQQRSLRGLRAGGPRK